MEHLTLDRVALMIGQLELSVLNLQIYVEELENKIKELKKDAQN